MNQRNEIYNFISIVKDYVNEIPEMRYKVDLEKSMLDKYQKILEREEGRRMKPWVSDTKLLKN